jgi:hypothetical protein
MRNVSIAVLVILLGALAGARPAWSQSSCPYIAQYEDIPCANVHEGCFNYYRTHDCWSYGVPPGGDTCGCQEYVTCCGEQYLATPKQICVPGSGCAGCDPRSGDAVRLASTPPQQKPALVQGRSQSKSAARASLAKSTLASDSSRRRQ